MASREFSALVLTVPETVTGPRPARRPLPVMWAIPCLSTVTSSVDRPSRTTGTRGPVGPCSAVAGAWAGRRHQGSAFQREHPGRVRREDLISGTYFALTGGPRMVV